MNRAYHCAVTAVPVTVGLEGRGHGLELAVGSLNLESVLKEDNVDFSILVLAFLLQQGGQGPHDGLSLSDGLAGEETELSALGSEDLILVLGERGESGKLLEDGAGYQH